MRYFWLTLVGLFLLFGFLYKLKAQNLPNIQFFCKQITYTPGTAKWQIVGTGGAQGGAPIALLYRDNSPGVQDFCVVTFW